MRSNSRLQRVLQVRQLGGSFAVVADDSTSTFLGDAKLFAMTFTCGFLFTTIFLA